MSETLMSENISNQVKDMNLHTHRTQVPSSINPGIPTKTQCSQTVQRQRKNS